MEPLSPEDDEQFWEEILLELETHLERDDLVFIDDYDPRQPHEIVIGTMTEKLKVVAYVKAQVEQEHLERPNPLLDQKRKVLDEMFWAMVGKIYPETTDGETYQSVGLRKGFVIVAIKKSFSPTHN